MVGRKLLTAVMVVAMVATAATGSVGALTAPSADATTAVSETTVTVTNVVDGDTVDIEYQNGSTDTVRLLGVDTPETYGSVSPGEFEGVPDTQASRECLEAAGENASAYATDRLAGRTVTLQFDNQADRRGYYGRLLAYVQVNGSNFNYDLVETGHARVYDSTFSESESFYNAESAAQAAERNVWDCRTPDDGGSGDDSSDNESSGDASALSIAWVNAEGDSLNDERVKIETTGSSSVTLDGVTLSDAAGHSHTFSGLTLGAGDAVYVHTGSGTDDADDRYMGYEMEIWNDDGDTATLTAANGTVVDEYQYGDASGAPGEVTIEWVNAEVDSLNAERVKLTNTGNGPIDLSGYTLSDAANHEFAFPDGFTLGAGESVYVHTGSGTDDSDDLYMGYEMEIWNDGGDTATVRTADGAVVDELSY
ncbi:lamin tail domain-containing protein [Halosimplex halobium]|uniref:lamin tail domain-containing protein n=1 Tax=Halosimplex halobium TaxID=3396618 RepID=UPI003F54C488